MIPYGRQSIDESDIAAVVEVLRSDWLTQGPAVDEFERSLCSITGARHAIAFANGTAALHGATAAAGLGHGDLVATSALSFVASANCARYVGADVVFVDIDEHTLSLRPEAVPQNVAALVAVHYAGLPVDLSRLQHRPRIVIEDAAHALGALTVDGPVGNCARSDMCMFSFHPVKTVTTAEGGAVTTNDDALASRLRQFRTHHIRRDPSSEPWVYDIDGLGFNYRMSDLHAALGVSQLKRLERFVAKRNELADRYRVELAMADVTLPPGPASADVRHAYHLFPIRVRNRGRVFHQLRERGIGVQVHFVPIHHHSVYRSSKHHLPVTDRIYEELITLPLYPTLAEDEQSRVIDEVRAATGS